MTDSAEWGALLAALPSDYLGAAAVDSEFAVRAVDQGVVDRSGFTRDQLLSMNALDMIHPDDVARAASALLESLTIDGTRLPALYRLQIRPGEYEPFEVRAINLPGFDGALAVQIFEPNLSARVDVFADELARMMQLLVAPAPLSESLDRIAEFAERHIENMTVSITAFQSDGSSVTTDRPDVPQSVLAENQFVHVLVPPPHVAAAVEARLAPGGDSYAPGVSDDQIPGRVTVAALDDDETLLGFIEGFRSTTGLLDRNDCMVLWTVEQLVSMMLVRRRLDEQLRFAADRDPLTGLLNRRRLLGDMAECPSLAGSGLLLIDLDDFSWVNNMLGHAAGDRAIVAAAEHMVSTVPDAASVARWGGDEFVVWLPEAIAADELDRLAERLRAAMRVPVTVSDSRSLLRCSIGAAVIEAGETPEDAINRADKAMYAAKRAGGDRVNFVH